MKKLFLLLTLLIIVSQQAKAQGVSHVNIALFNSSGFAKPVGGAVITVCAANNVSVPCSAPLSNTLFKDFLLSVPITNPFNADANGNYSFMAAPGNYTVTITGVGINGYTYQLSLIGPSVGTANVWTALQTFSGGAIITGGSAAFTNGVSSTNGGVFTNTQNNDYMKSTLNACNSQTEYQVGQPSNFYTAPISSCMAVPGTSTVQGAFGLIGLVNNSSTTTNAAGFYTQSRCLVTGAHCWGGNPWVSDLAGQVGILTGQEVDVTLFNTAYGATPPAGLNIAANFVAGQPSGGTAAFISKPLGSGTWPAGWACNEASVTLVCVGLNPLASGANSNSSAIQGNVRDSGNVIRANTIFADSSGAWTINSFLGKLILDNNAVQRGLFDYSGNTGLRTYTTPDTSGSLSLATVEYCGATTGATQACAKTVQTLPITVWGDVTLNTATTQSITTLPFTDALYSCTGSDLTTVTGIVSFNTYTAASVTIAESGGVNTDHLRYVCVGH